MPKRRILKYENEKVVDQNETLSTDDSKAIATLAQQIEDMKAEAQLLGLDINLHLNMFESSGKWHNEVMEEIGRNIDITNPDRTVIYSILKKNINQRYPHMKYHDFDSYSKMVDDMLLYSSLQLDVEAEEGGAYSSSHRTNEMIKEFEVLVNNLINSEEVKSPYRASRELSKLKTKIILKYGVPVYVNGRGNGVATILAVSSITENSYSYWHQALTSSNSTWNGVFGGDITEPRARAGALKRWLRDARGFFFVDWSHSSDGYYHGEWDEATACATEYSGS